MKQSSDEMERTEEPPEPRSASANADDNGSDDLVVRLPKSEEELDQEARLWALGEWGPRVSVTRQRESIPPVTAPADYLAVENAPKERSDEPAADSVEEWWTSGWGPTLSAETEYGSSTPDVEVAFMEGAPPLPDSAADGRAAGQDLDQLEENRAAAEDDELTAFEDLALENAAPENAAQEGANHLVPASTDEYKSAEPQSDEHEPAETHDDTDVVEPANAETAEAIAEPDGEERDHHDVDLAIAESVEGRDLIVEPWLQPLDGQDDEPDLHEVLDAPVDESASQVTSGPPAPADPADAHVLDPARKTALRRGLVAAGLSMILATVGIAGLAALSARSDLTLAREGAAQAVAALSRGDLPATRTAVDQARDAADSAQSSLGNRALGVIGAIPVAGNTVDTVRAVGNAVDDVVQIADDLVTAIEDLPDGLDSLKPVDDRIPVDQIAALAPTLGQSSETATAALESVQNSPTSAMPGVVVDARTEALELLRGLDTQLATAASLSTALPAFLGADGPREYFVAAQNPAEIRGAGGFLGVWSTLSVDDGRIELGEFTEIRELTDVAVEDIEPPTEDFAARYDQFGGAGFWRNINMSPDVPVVAEAIVNLYEVSEGDRLDGVIFVDPFIMQSAMGLTGPVTINDFGEVTAESVVQTVVIDAYRVLQDQLGADARRDILGDVAGVVIDQLLTGAATGNTRQLIDVFGSSAANRHLFLYAATAEEQTAFVDAGLAGQLPQPEGDFLMVTLNNAAANKIDTFIDSHLTYEVALQADGAAEALLTTTLENNAFARAEPGYIIGPNVDYLNAGDSLLYVSTYCAQSCEMAPFDEPHVMQVEAGHPVNGRSERLRSGAIEEVEMRWSIGEAWEPNGSTGTYTFTYRPQPLFIPTELDVSIALPEDVVVTEISNPAFRLSEDGRTVTFSGDPRRTIQVTVLFVSA